LILAEERAKALESAGKTPLELDYDQLAKALCANEALIAHNSQHRLLPADFLVSPMQAFASTMASALEEVLIE
jgi:hypothetical protein